jgi:hypothetical protein
LSLVSFEGVPACTGTVFRTLSMSEHELESATYLCPYFLPIRYLISPATVPKRCPVTHGKPIFDPGMNRRGRVRMRLHRHVMGRMCMAWGSVLRLRTSA